MLTNERIRPYIFIFLAFCVLSSKNILIYNEETLVAISFLCFTIFVYRYFGNTVKESLNERSSAIQQELQNFLTIKQDSLTQLLNQHKKFSGLLKALNSLELFTNTELVRANIYGEKALTNLFAQQLQYFLKNLTVSKMALQQKLQKLIAENILSGVLIEEKRLKTHGGLNGKPQNEQTMKNAIKLLLNNIEK